MIFKKKSSPTLLIPNGLTGKIFQLHIFLAKGEAETIFAASWGGI
jgi:hypothetical protein